MPSSGDFKSPLGPSELNITTIYLSISIVTAKIKNKIAIWVDRAISYNLFKKLNLFKKVFINFILTWIINCNHFGKILGRWKNNGLYLFNEFFPFPSTYINYIEHISIKLRLNWNISNCREIFPTAEKSYFQLKKYFQL